MDRAIFGGLAEKVARDDGLRNKPAAQPVQCIRQFGGIEVEGALVDINEQRSCAGQRHRLGGGHEGEGRAENRVFRPDPLSHQGDDQRIGTRSTAYRMLDASAPGKLLFELLDGFSHDILAAAQYVDD